MSNLYDRHGLPWPEKQDTNGERGTIMFTDTDGYLVSHDTLAGICLWKMQHVPEKTLFVHDGSKHLLGFLSADAFPPFSSTLASATAGDLCRRDVHSALAGENAYMAARDIMARWPSVKIVPVLDAEGCVIGVLRRWQCYFKDSYFTAIRTTQETDLPYPPYAVTIWRAAEVARSIGVSSFSVCEFGVAAGDGLCACELLAREIGHIFDLEIKVFGFDGGQGLPAPQDWRDCPQCWDKGLFPMDVSALRQRLASATVVLGPLEETLPVFFATYAPPPVGVMLVDVDYYSSTVPVLSLLEENAESFLPLVNMYFDDVGGDIGFQGEALAIHEFNTRHELRKISPELESFGEYNFHGRRYGFSKLKTCLLFDHSSFTAAAFAQKILHFAWR